MTSVADFDLSVEELRLVACFVADASEPLIAQAAEPLIPGYETARPDDPRPGAAVAAARAFITGAPRSRWQRLASMDAHRAAAESGTESARLAAQAAGDAACAAYLHPIAKAHQVGHILRADANAARIAEIVDGPFAAARVLESARRRAEPGLVDVLRRYPPHTSASNRVAQLISALDSALRSR
ncbi:exonuclease SbcC [Mycolicibacterium neoaurum]|uniref:Exonuclease SbcC n=1 Tax=Mycolicibacterium neoaurum VKM Ac-1815D TaxID=700508 RepID=V5XAR2_MYCNE|nr:exonuclease SbcC [Mycolicibacterium neoaurum]